MTKQTIDSDIDDIDEDDVSDLHEPAPEEDQPIILTLPEDACGIRLDKVLSQLVPQFSRSRIQQWLDAGHVMIDGQPGRSKTLVLGDETVVIHPQAAPQERAFTPEPISLSIFHDDAVIVIVDKPVGLVVHPAAGNWSGTLLNGLLHRWPALSGVPRAGIVHRLDQDPSGMMVVAKTLEAQTDLVRQLQARSVRREYLALVWGKPQVGGKIEAPIGRHPRDRIKMAVTDGPGAKPAITHYERIATGSLDGRIASLVRCKLETGRTHQIRVHMQSIGFPLVGDALYGKPHLVPVFGRQALHAYRLGLLHPAAGDYREWQSPLAEDFAGLLTRAGIDGEIP